MKIWMTSTAAALTLGMSLFGAAQAQAATVFESFPNYATAGAPNAISCSSCTGYGELFGSFSLGSSQTLNLAYLLVNNGNDPHNAMTISIFNDGGNDLPATNITGGILNPILFQNYTNPSSVISEPGNNSLISLALPNWQLNAGKYWIRFAGYGNTLPQFTTATPDHSRVVGSDFFSEGRTVVYNPTNLALGFSLNGVDITPQGAVPEPGTWALMLAGFSLVGVALRRRQVVRVSFV